MRARTDVQRILQRGKLDGCKLEDGGDGQGIEKCFERRRECLSLGERVEEGAKREATFVRLL